MYLVKQEKCLGRFDINSGGEDSLLTHFGINVQTDELYLTRENYISCKDKEFRSWYRYLSSDIFDSLDDRVVLSDGKQDFL